MQQLLSVTLGGTRFLPAHGAERRGGDCRAWPTRAKPYNPREVSPPGFPDWLGQLGSRERYPGARPTVPVCAAVGLLVSRHVLLRTAFQVPACPCQSSCGLNHPRPLANHANGNDKSRGGNSFERLCGYCYPHISKNDKLYNGGTFLTKNQAKQNGHGQNANLVAFVHGRLQMALGGAIAYCVTGIRDYALCLFRLSTLIGVSLNTRFSAPAWSPGWGRTPPGRRWWTRR